ncbi:unnamed protein product [Brassicogethes aeneus]|uniref:Uncharacterized protein n=1 Tax=Brassicogethes aeneus TaxID=1431903 RepID=A0A9P0FDJ5_BRAAE|nr:unnamed protein product [Brassicogethes aeneus]
MKLTRILHTKLTKYEEIIKSAQSVLSVAPQVLNKFKEDGKKTLLVKLDELNGRNPILKEGPQILSKYKKEKKKSFLLKLVQVNKWYIRTIGIEKVQEAQLKVNSIQDDLIVIQTNRRELQKKLDDIRVNRDKIHDEMVKVDKNVNFEQYINLRNQETEILKIMQSLTQTYTDYDRKEKEMFTALTSAIRDSNEQQRLQMEYTKYIGPVMSIIASLLTFIYGTLRKEELKKYVENILLDLRGHIQTKDLDMAQAFRRQEEQLKLLANQKFVLPASAEPKIAEVPRQSDNSSFWKYLTIALGILLFFRS